MQPESVPSQMAQLLSTDDAASREAAWSGLLAQYSRLILSVARNTTRDYDDAMDRYAYVLSRLREDDFRRLRAYRAAGNCKFTTWLVVVCRRLCIDQHRSKEGRSGSEVIRLPTRRNLARLIFEQLEIDAIPDTIAKPADVALEEREQEERLRRCTERLDARDQLLLKLRFEDDLSAAEIMRIMGLRTPFHVYRRINGLLKDLRVALLFSARARKVEPNNRYIE